MIKKIILSVLLVIATLLAQAQQSFEDEASFKKYFESHKDSLDQIEGIWNISTVQQYYRYDTMYDEVKYHKAARVAIIKRNDHYDSFNLTGESYNIEFTNTGVKGVYMYKNYFKETGSFSKADALISKNGEMGFSYEFPADYLRFKLGDSYEPGTRVINNSQWKKTFPETSVEKKESFK